MTKQQAFATKSNFNKTRIYPWTKGVYEAHQNKDGSWGVSFKETSQFTMPKKERSKTRITKVPRQIRVKGSDAMSHRVPGSHKRG